MCRGVIYKMDSNGAGCLDSYSLGIWTWHMIHGKMKRKPVARPGKHFSAVGSSHMISLLECIKSKIGGKDRWICQQLLSFEDFEAIFPIARFPADVGLLVVGLIFVPRVFFWDAVLLALFPKRTRICLIEELNILMTRSDTCFLLYKPILTVHHHIVPTPSSCTCHSWKVVKFATGACVETKACGNCRQKPWSYRSLCVTCTWAETCGMAVRVQFTYLVRCCR